MIEFKSEKVLKLGTENFKHRIDFFMLGINRFCFYAFGRLESARDDEKLAL